MQELDNAIMKNRDFSCAYVYQEATAQFLLKLTNFFTRGAVGNRGRIMKEQLCKSIDKIFVFVSFQLFLTIVRRLQTNILSNIENIAP